MPSPAQQLVLDAINPTLEKALAALKQEIAASGKIAASTAPVDAAFQNRE